MPHIFKSFGMKEISFGEYNVQKNTKKAVQKAIEELRVMTSQQSIVVNVDVSVVTDPDKLQSLFHHSFQMYRNFGGRTLSAIKLVFAQPLSQIEITDVARQQFLAIRTKGLSNNAYTLDQIVMFSRIINEHLDMLVSKYKELTERYRIEIERAEGKSAELEFKRRFSFSTFQTNLKELYRKCFNELDYLLDPANVINPSPSFQRSLVWSLEKKEAFIRSIMNEIPIGTFYVNQQLDYDPEWKLGEGYGELLWDGKQRIHALHSFILGEFSVELNGRRLFYYDDSHFFNLKFGDCQINIIQSRFDNMRDIIEAYVVINSAQVKHTDEDLQKAIDYLEEFQKSN